MCIRVPADMRKDDTHVCPPFEFEKRESGLPRGMSSLLPLGNPVSAWPDIATRERDSGMTDHFRPCWNALPISGAQKTR